MSSLFGRDFMREVESVLNATPGWCHTDDIVQALDAREAWGDFEEHAILEAKRARVRRVLRQLRDPDGVRRVASVEVPTEDGGTERRYKQETFFELDDYRQVVQYHVGRSLYHHNEARGYAERCQARFGENPMALG